MITTQLEEGILTIVINRPDKLNALNKAVLSELHRVFREAIDDNQVKGMLLTGSGEKAFAAGADIAEFAHYSEKEGRELAESGQGKVFDIIGSSPKPVVAAINGYALGGGLELALACHLRIASVQAKMGLPEVTLGLIPGYGGTQRLTRLVGKGLALEMILTGKTISAEKALQSGLINYQVEPGRLLPAARELLTSITRHAPLAIAAAIRSVNACHQGKEKGFRQEIEEFGRLFGTRDFREGTKAFLEKRKPVFKGE